MCPSEQWKHGHNYIHHTYTNILGKDRDIGYGILRMDEDQQWRPYYLGNPLYAFLLMMFFEWGVALHDLEVENIISGKRNARRTTSRSTRGLLRKMGRQVLKDYVLFPALTGPLFPLDARRQRDRQPDPQHLGVQHHLLRPLPGRRRDLHRGGDRGRDPRRLVLPPAARLGQHHRQQAVPRHDAATCRTRSSTTCSRTCRPAATRRSPARCARCARSTACTYNTGRSCKQLFSVAAKICRLALPGPRTKPHQPGASDRRRLAA